MTRTLTKTKIVRGSEYDPTRNTGDKALLLSPPAYDFRLDWPSWHFPNGLLKLGAVLQAQRYETRLIDCLQINRGMQPKRKKIGTADVQGRKLDKWHFGMPYETIERQIKGYLQEEWIPTTAFVTSLNSTWWEGARDTIAILRKLLPKTKLVLGGAYPTVFPEHAKLYSGADIAVSGPIPRLSRQQTSLSLYDQTPYSSGIYFYGSPSIYPRSRAPKPRTTSAIVNEVMLKARAGVREFLFFDEDIKLEDRDSFGCLLDKLATVEYDIHFVLLGNIAPQLVTRAFARKLRRANVSKIYLRCELEFESQSIYYPPNLADYNTCIAALLDEEVVKPRADGIAAMLVAGLPFEDIDAVCERLVKLAHIVGSVIVVPFQYVPGLHTGPIFERVLAQAGHMPPEAFNSKLFPIARLSGRTLEDYVEIMRLAALLNSKYRSQTFDFLGDGFAAKLFRETLRTGAWNPFQRRVD